MLWFFGFFGGGNAGRGEIRGVYLLTLVSYALLYLFTWTKGRAVFLAGALLAFASWAAFEVADSSTNVVPFQQELSTSSDSTNFGFSATVVVHDPRRHHRRDRDDVAVHRPRVPRRSAPRSTASGYEGAATPFVAVGAIETLAGAIVLGGNDSVLLGGFLAVGAGAVVGLVGARGDRRRATTWIGVLAVFGGLVAVLSDIAPDSAAGVGGIAFGFALALGAIAWWLAPVLGEVDDGDESPPPPSIPPGGDSATTTLPGTDDRRRLIHCPVSCA